MKRYNHLFDKIASIENLRLAEQKARKGKKHSYGVHKWSKNAESNLLLLHEELINGRYKTGPYSIFETTCSNGKVRIIYRLDFKHRIVHHAIMIVLEPIWMSVFTRDTYSCIKKRGIHGALHQMMVDLKDVEGTQYCLKLDITKFYPSINHDLLKGIVRKKIKDSKLLNLIDEVIDSADGVPIGNYLSQYLANLYLAYFDHWVKECLKVKYYYRYADDIVLLSSSKDELWQWLVKIRQYLEDDLKLKIKKNYQVFPVASRGIDFVGYVSYHTYVRMRKSIKKSFARAVKNKNSKGIIASYYGWAVHCNSKHLLKKLGMYESLLRSTS